MKLFIILTFTMGLNLAFAAQTETPCPNMDQARRGTNQKSNASNESIQKNTGQIVKQVRNQ